MSDSAGFRPALRSLIGVRLREFFREPEAVFWVYVFPILLATGLGIAFRSQPPERIRVGWGSWNGDSSAPLLQGLLADSTLIVERFADSTASALALRNGRVALLVLPESGGVRYRFDDTRPEAAQARLRVDDALQRAAGRVDPLQSGSEVVRERGSRYIDFLLPGLLGLNLMGSGIWGTGFAIVDARKKKLLKRLVATPMSRADYLASFPLAQLLLLVLEIGTILTFGVLAFHVPVRGSLGAVAAVCVLGSLTFGAMGLLAAARPTTIEGISGLANLMMMPMWVLSGVFFSSARFPEVVQPIVKALPLTVVVDALRAIMLEGATLASLAGRLAILLVWLVLAFVVALRTFRWQ
jgi:ABC-type polysaccharide/polyol phosphate export permease